jgi:hypothetical protein
MEESDPDVEEIDPSVINWIRRKKYRRRILIEPLDPYFCRRSKRNAISQPIINIEDDDTPVISSLAMSSTTKDVGIR